MTLQPAFVCVTLRVGYDSRYTDHQVLSCERPEALNIVPAKGGTVPSFIAINPNPDLKPPSLRV